MRTLSEFAWNTQKLSSTTLALRGAVQTSHSPEKLLFHDMPVALNQPPFSEDEKTRPQQVEKFFDCLNEALQELAQAMPNAVAQARDQLLIACDFPVGEKGWEAFRQEAAVLLPYTNQPNLLPLLKRAAETDNPDAALDSVLAFIANRPPRVWSDIDVKRFPDQAEQVGKIFKAERSGYDPMAGLSPTQRKESQQIADKLQNYISMELNADPVVQRAALRALLKELESVPSTNGHHPTNHQATSPEGEYNRVK
jgi:hypothetical protein